MEDQMVWSFTHSQICGQDYRMITVSKYIILSSLIKNKYYVKSMKWKLFHSFKNRLQQSNSSSPILLEWHGLKLEIFLITMLIV